MSTKPKLNSNQVKTDSPDDREPLTFIPEEKQDSPETTPEINCSFIDYLDSTNVSMSTSKKRLTLKSPKKLPVQKKIESLCSPVKRKKRTIITDAESNSLSSRFAKENTPPEKNVDFSISDSHEAEIVDASAVLAH